MAKHQVIAEDQYTYVCKCGACIYKLLGTTKPPLEAFADHVRNAEKTKLVIRPYPGELAESEIEEVRDAIETMMWNPDIGSERFHQTLLRVIEDHVRDERIEWAEWLETRESAVLDKPVKISDVITWLRSGKRPFGRSQGEPHE